MASIQQKGTAYYCQFRYLDRRHTVTVGIVTAAEAEAFAGNVDYLLMRLKQKLLHIPPGVSVADFVLHNGQPPEPAARAAQEAVTPAGGLLTLRACGTATSPSAATGRWRRTAWPPFGCTLRTS